MTERINLKDFLRTIKLGSIHLGQHENNLAAILCKPDYMGGTSRKYRQPSLWKYGDIELFFDYKTRKISSIVINFWKPEYPSGGGAIQLDPWVIRGGLQPEALQLQLDKEGIVYREVEPINYETRQLLVNSAITMIFNNDIEEWAGRVGLCKIYAGE
jgi:hypothetical protein